MANIALMENQYCQPDAALQHKLGHTFTHPELLAQALTHPSWANEHGVEHGHNQRLEFLGDAVLQLCVSAELYHRFPDAREGPLTEMRSGLVSENALARVALELGVDKALRLAKGEEKQNGRHKASLLADAFEAVLAAVYEDGGLGAAQRVVSRIFSDRWPKDVSQLRERDAKSRLQEYCQKTFKTTPSYTLLRSNGPEHAKCFEVSLRMPDGNLFFGRESSCKKAEQAAAQAALCHLGLH